MNTIDRARETVRRQLGMKHSAAKIKAYLIAYYGATLPSVAIMAYDGNDRVDSVLRVAARQWVRANTTIAKE